MHKERLVVDVALGRLRETRPAAEPNEGFMRQLRELQDFLLINHDTILLLINAFLHSYCAIIQGII